VIYPPGLWLLRAILLALALSAVPGVAGETADDLYQGAIGSLFDHSDPFFQGDSYGWPPNIIEHADGHLEDGYGGDPSSVQKFRHTARVASSHILPHTIEQAYAWLDPDGATVIYLVFDAPSAASDYLEIRIRDAMFEARYWTNPLLTGSQISWNVVEAVIHATPGQASVGDVVAAVVDVRVVGVDDRGRQFSNHLEGPIKPVLQAQAPRHYGRRAPVEFD